MKSRLPGGFGKGSNSINNIVKQAQKMQSQMSEIQEKLNSEEFQGTSGGGAVTVTIYGNKLIKTIKLKPEIVDPNDVEMLEDLIVAAFNQAIEIAESELNKRMESITGNVSIPGLI